jgi:hypothetical protein
VVATTKVTRALACPGPTAFGQPNDSARGGEAESRRGADVTLRSVQGHARPAAPILGDACERVVATRIGP